jgi:hypothetical protein
MDPKRDPDESALDDDGIPDHGEWAGDPSTEDAEQAAVPPRDPGTLPEFWMTPEERRRGVPVSERLKQERREGERPPRRPPRLVKDDHGEAASDDEDLIAEETSETGHSAEETAIHTEVEP